MSGSTAGGCSLRQMVRSFIRNVLALCLSASCAPRRCRRSLCTGCATLREPGLAKGVNAAIVSRRLGHATVAFTLDIYSHVLPQVDAEAAEMIAAFATR